MSRQEPAPRAKKPKLVPRGPRTAKTAALWEAAERERLLDGHPADCQVCSGASDPETIVALHRQYWAALSERAREDAARRKQITDAWYAGAHRMVIDGVPLRCAAHVAKWKASNRAALCKGSDRWGLQLERPPTKGAWDWLPDRFRRSGYWQNYHAVAPLEKFFSSAECCDLINSGEYSKWRPSQYGGGLFGKRQEYERNHARAMARASISPDLWQWARGQRRLERSKRKSLEVTA